MNITCYECGKLFEASSGFYHERRVSNPNAIPAETESTGHGYCSQECAERHHILENDIELQDLGNYEETPDSILMTSPDGGFRGEVLRVQEIKKHGKEKHAA